MGKSVGAAHGSERLAQEGYCTCRYKPSNWLGLSGVSSAGLYCLPTTGCALALETTGAAAESVDISFGAVCLFVHFVHLLPVLHVIGRYSWLRAELGRRRKQTSSTNQKRRSFNHTTEARSTHTVHCNPHSPNELLQCVPRTRQVDESAKL